MTGLGAAAEEDMAALIVVWCGGCLWGQSIDGWMDGWMGRSGRGRARSSCASCLPDRSIERASKQASEQASTRKRAKGYQTLDNAPRHLLAPAAAAAPTPPRPAARATPPTTSSRRDSIRFSCAFAYGVGWWGVHRRGGGSGVC